MRGIAQRLEALLYQWCRIKLLNWARLRLAYRHGIFGNRLAAAILIADVSRMEVGRMQ